MATDIYSIEVSSAHDEIGVQDSDTIQNTRKK